MVYQMPFIGGGEVNISKIKFTTVLCLALILFSAFFLVQSMQLKYWQGYGPGAGFVPLWCSGITLGLSIISFIQSFKRDGIKLSEVFPAGIGRKNIIITWLSLVFFVVFAKILGFIATSVIMLTVLFNRSLKLNKAIISSVILAVCCFVLFKLILQVPVPVNKFGW